MAKVTEELSRVLEAELTEIEARLRAATPKMIVTAIWSNVVIAETKPKKVAMSEFLRNNPKTYATDAERFYREVYSGRISAQLAPRSVRVGDEITISVKRRSK